MNNSDQQAISGRSCTFKSLTVKKGEYEWKENIID